MAFNLSLAVPTSRTYDRDPFAEEPEADFDDWVRLLHLAPDADLSADWFLPSRSEA